MPSQYCKHIVENSNNSYLAELDKVDTSIPFFWTGNQVITSNYSDYNIWGAPAGMLVNLFERIKSNA